MPALPRKLVIPVLLGGLLILTFLVYSPGLTGDFVFDDASNIVMNRNVHLESLNPAEVYNTLTSGIATNIGRPLSMLTFGLNYYFSGLSPGIFKLTNICIHLLTALSLYFLTLQLLSIGAAQRHTFRIPPKYIALLVSAAWALHPLNVSTVLYVVQRMTQIAALFTVLALLLYCKFRQRTNLGVLQIALAHGLLGLMIILGVMGKENAALAVLFIAVIEYSLFGLHTSSAQQRFYRTSFFVLFMILPGVGAGFYLWFHPDYILRAYEIRDFTMAQRVLSEGRIVWDYFRWVLAPDTREFVFYHENYPFSTGLFSPLSTLFAAVGIAFLVALVVLLRRRLPWVSFGIGFFLAGHVLESTFVGLELIFEHRNYLPCYGLLFGFIATLFSSPLELLNRRIGVAFSLLYLAFFVESTYGETTKWSSSPAHVLGMYRDEPNSRRINYGMGYVYYQLALAQDNSEYLREAKRYFYRAAELDDRVFQTLAAFVHMSARAGDPIPEEVLAEFYRRLRTTYLGGGDLIELNNLSSCFFSSLCPGLRDLLPGIYKGIGENTALPPVRRQLLLDELATNLLVSFRRIHDALAIYYYAETLTPDLSLVDIKIISLELDRSQLDAARRHLDKSSLKPALARYLENALDDVRQIVEEREAESLQR